MLLAMPGDDVDKFLEDAKSFESRKQALIDAVLKERAAALKAFDDKLAKLGYEGDGARSRKSHHKKTTAEKTAAASKEKPKV